MSVAHHLRLATVPTYVVTCLVLGGASAAGLWANMALQLLAIPILFWALVARQRSVLSATGRQLLLLTLLLIAVVALQLIPLPPGIWTMLPGREAVADGFELLGRPLPWIPISLDPINTLASALWLLPALAVLVGILRLGAYKATWLSWAIAAVTVLSVVLGTLQVMGQTSWYIYKITNYGATTGFFANANHMATLLVITIPFLTALLVRARSSAGSTQSSAGMMILIGGALVVTLVGIVINGSLAGIGLALSTLAASAFMLFFHRRALPRWTGPATLLLFAGTAAGLYFAPISNIIRSTSAQLDAGARHESFTISTSAAADYFPGGSGIGTFVEIYRTYEDPATVTRFYMNHVHNDYIEIALETGLLGLALLALFLLWWFRRTAAIWLAEKPDLFARASTIASGAVLVHSLVDYPLRTAAISAVFAACLALMSDPRERTRRAERSSSDREVRHLSAD
jgi:O-antigen ligase